MKPKRTYIAAGGTMVALGALAAVAIGAAPGTSSTAVSTPKAQPIEVRTVVVHRTIRVVRHEKPKKPKAVAAPPAPAVQSAPVQIARAPVQVSKPAYTPVAATPAPTSTKPLKTATSGGSSGSEHEDNEHEGGGEDD